MVDLTRELDRVKADVFSGKNAAFLGSLMVKLPMHWDTSIKTAQTDFVSIAWNPEWFMSIPRKTRGTVLVHEIWHVARLHASRQGSRDMETWNYACDLEINNALDYAGYSFEGTQPWLDHQYDNMAAEDIYDVLIQNQIKPPPGGAWGCGKPDMCSGDGLSPLGQLNLVVGALTHAKLAGEAGTLPGDVLEVIKKFLKPVVPWEKLLMDFMTELSEEFTTWARPNRRYPEMYMPSRDIEEGKLAHMAYFLDVSGSITSRDALRFNSEVKFVFETYKPEKLTLILFDVVIQRIYEFEEDDDFTEVEICGRGGTSLVCVRNWIEQNRPTAAMIFTDLEVDPMEPLTYDLPLLWICNKAGKSVPFGKLIHIKE
ncbi:putative metallopeptidase domain protein [Erwinia phage Kuerle]|nr:putative metallopeptidase domain protein [Erwinia phage Kuerle]